jgi:hypothetical protein
VDQLKTWLDSLVPPVVDDLCVLLPLTQEKFALADKADTDLILSTGAPWHAIRRPSGAWYAASGASPNRVYLHQLIAGVKAPDHANRDGLDNRRVNLRVATPSQNNINHGLSSDNTSGYKGVSWQTSARKWRAQIGVEGEHIYLGLFEDPAQAARAYNRAALEHFGEFAWLNPLPLDLALASERDDNRAKLTAEIVRECRLRAAAGEAKIALAREFGIGKNAMIAAINGRSWRHVPIPDASEPPAA